MQPKALWKSLRDATELNDFFGKYKCDEYLMFRFLRSTQVDER